MITHCDTLISLVYVSSAVDLFSQKDLLTLLEISRCNNTPVGITGMLLYKDGNFMQAIEGDETEIHKLQARIARDPRHTDLITLMERKIERRQFPEWTMGFKNLSDPVLRANPGYNEFLNTPLTDKDFVSNPTRADRLLETFKKRM